MATKKLMDDKRHMRDVVYNCACDSLLTLLNWCRDPIVAESQEGNTGFWDAVRIAEICLERVEKVTDWKRAP